jgi:hypothetical protein
MAPRMCFVLLEGAPDRDGASHNFVVTTFLISYIVIPRCMPTRLVLYLRSTMLQYFQCFWEAFVNSVACAEIDTKSMFELHSSKYLPEGLVNDRAQQRMKVANLCLFVKASSRLDVTALI